MDCCRCAVHQRPPACSRCWAGRITGGTWTAPGGAAHSGTFDPSWSPAGAYTYTIAAIAPCAGDQSQVTVSVNPSPDAGVDGAITLCDVGAPQGLFASIGGTPDAGGTWTAPGGGAFSGTYDPALDAPGTYTYTVTGVAPCPNDQSTVTVTETGQPNAGSDGLLTLCSSSAATGLFGLLGGANWRDVDGPGGAAHSGTFDPSVDAAGVYIYTIAAIAPCAGDQSQVTVGVNPSPDAGVDGATTLCDVGAPQGLFGSISGTPDAEGEHGQPRAAVRSVGPTIRRWTHRAYTPTR